MPPADWDQRVQQYGGGILQSRPWGQFQEALGRELVWAEGEGWQWLAAIRRSRGLRYLMCNYGPVATDEATMKAAVASLVSSATKLQADFVRLEPQGFITASKLTQLGGRQITEVDPQYTRIVDLTADEAVLRDGLTSGHRNPINGTQRRGITIRQTDATADFELFLTMLANTAGHSHVLFYPEDYYRHLFEVLGSAGVAKLYLAEAEGQPVAAALFYDWGGTRYYAHAGAYQELNRRVKASVSLVWQALLDAKAAKMRRFDLWGVAPEGDDTHHLANLSRFKHGFGGTQLDYLGTWDVPIKRHKYQLYSLYRKLRSLNS